MDAQLVHAFVAALPDRAPGEGSLARVRACLTSLHDPDLRYLVAAVAGPGAAAVARVLAAVLVAAGARTGTLGRALPDIAIDGVPIDDALLGQAGTLAASASYHLQETNGALGELGRREAVALIGLVAFAEANERVALLLDERLDAADPVHAPRPDLVVVTRIEHDQSDRALGLIPEGRPAVVAALGTGVRERIEGWAETSGTPLLLGDRDHRVYDEGGQQVFAVRGEPFVTFDPVPGFEPWQIGCGIAGALGLGVMGIRMREDWVLAGLASLRARSPERVAP